jgi:hypothetical protein
MKAITKQAPDLQAQLAGWQAAVNKIHDANRAGRDAHRTAERERQRLVSAPPPLPEVIAAMEGVIDAIADAWVAESGLGLVAAFGPGLRLREDGTLEVQAPRLPDWFILRDVRLKDLCGLVPELVKQRLAAIIMATPYEAGPAQADRVARVAEAEAKIAAIEAEHTALVDLAASFDPPIVLPLLPAVAERRAAEAARVRREAVERERREAREVAINRHAATHSAGGPSPYLAEQQARRQL